MTALFEASKTTFFSKGGTPLRLLLLLRSGANKATAGAQTGAWGRGKWLIDGAVEMNIWLVNDG